MLPAYSNEEEETDDQRDNGADWEDKMAQSSEATCQQAVKQIGEEYWMHFKDGKTSPVPSDAKTLLCKKPSATSANR